MQNRQRLSTQWYINVVFARLAAGMVAIAAMISTHYGILTSTRNPMATIDGFVGGCGGISLFVLSYLIFIRNRLGYTVGIFLGAMAGPVAGWSGTHTKIHEISLVIISGFMLIFLIVLSWRSDRRTIRPFAHPVDGKY